MLSPADIHIRHFSTFPHGGAAMAAARLHTGLQKYGVNSEFVYHRDQFPRDRPSLTNAKQIEFDKKAHLRKNDGQPLDWFSYRIARFREKQIHRAYHHHIATRPVDFDTFAMANLPYPTPIEHRAQHNQLVHLHWLSFFLDYPSFFSSIPDVIPIVWTLHDMNAFTGGCHFSINCDRFKSGCGGCPQIDRPKTNDVSRRSFDSKQTALLGKNLHVVAPCDWLFELAQQSPLWPANTTFHKIHYGVDLKSFYPVDAQQARKSLGVSTDTVLIAFGAEDLTNNRKGSRYLSDALEFVQKSCGDQVECLFFGNGKIETTKNLPKIHRLGFVKGSARLRHVYSAADMVVVPSLQDNQPQVGLEAMACGTPVVAFDTGGIPEFVRHKETGLLATKADSSGLADQLIRLTRDVKLRNRLSTAARQMIEMEFETETQAWHYLKLYRDIFKARATETVQDQVTDQQQRRAA